MWTVIARFTYIDHGGYSASTDVPAFFVAAGSRWEAEVKANEILGTSEHGDYRGTLHLSIERTGR